MRFAAEHLSLPCAGHLVNGDAVVVRDLEDGALVALVDALGHGPTAAEIAACAATHLTDARLGDGVLAVMEDLHEALRGTRGVAALVLLLREGGVEGCSVGNVEMRVLGGTVPVVQSPGILGVRVRRYHVFRAELAPGARLVVFSDGISSSAPIAETREMGAGEACNFILRGYRRTHDDSTIVVIDVKD